MAKPSKQWMVTVTLTEKMRLGVDADWSDGKTLYIKNVLAGAVDHWNKQNPSLAVGTGDRILSVNHAQGDAQAMVREIKEKHVLQMLCEKGAGKADKESEPVAVPGMMRAGAGEQIPGMPQRTVDVLLELRAKAAQKEAGSAPAPMLPAEAGEPPNHYQVLGIDTKADDAAIKKSYRKLVLTWHPDKHPSDRDEAEVQIRLINLAYECISNPLKRQSYDQMLAALERKKLGIRLETQFIKPRMSIPKEFMLCPLGYSDKFVRVVDNEILIQTREEAPGTAFQEFFQAAKFSLWWLPEVNNMCRLRPRETAGQGMDGGNNLCFDFRPGDEEESTAEASCRLAEDQDAKKCNLIVSASPFSQGAFRFEAAFWPSRHLSYRRPGKILMAGKADSGSDSADFLLVDYSTAYKFMTTSEVLKGACESQGGAQGGYVKLSDLRADLSVRLYFQQMLGSAVWNNKDFETFFEGHYDEWDFDVKKSRVRMRPDGPLLSAAPAAPTAPVPMEVEASGLTERLRSAGNQSSTVKVLLAANGDELARLPPNAAIPVLNRLAEKSSQLPPEKLASLKAAKRRFLITLPVLLGEGVFSSKKERRRDSDVELLMKELLGMEKSVASIEREDAEKELATACKGARESIVELIGARIQDAPKDVTLDLLPELLAMPLNWGSVAVSLAEALTPLLQKQKPGALLPPLRTASRLGKGAAPVVECLGRIELRGIAYIDGGVAAEILTALAETGVETAAVASKLRPPLLPRLPLPELVSIVAALAEHGLSDDLLRPPLQARVAVAGPGLATVPSSRLLRLAAVAPRQACVAECALGPIAGAAAANLESWSPEDVAELMLVVATTASGPTTSPGAKRLFLRVGEVLIPQLEKVTTTVLLKVVVAAGAAATSCRELLEAAAGHIVGKLGDMKPEQVMLFTQGVLPLGGSHQVVVRLLTYWAQMLAGPIDSRDLTPDDIAQLAMLLAMVAPDHGLVFQVIGIRLQEAASRLTDAGHAALDAAFPGGAGPNFPGKEGVMTSLADAKRKRQEEADKKKVEALERKRKKEEEEEARRKSSEKSEKKSAKAARADRSRSRSRTRSRRR